MKAEDILWRVLDRLSESEYMLNDIIEDLDEEEDKYLLDALLEVEQLTVRQMNICRRLQRRMDRQR